MPDIGLFLSCFLAVLSGAIL